MRKDIIMSDELGCYYYTIFYPGIINLPENKGFVFFYRDRCIVVAVRKIIEALCITDFNNGFKTERKNDLLSINLTNEINSISKKTLYIEIEKGNLKSLVDYERYYHKEFLNKYYTELTLSFDAKKEEENIVFAGEVLDYFIETYRLISNNYYLLPRQKLGHMMLLEKEGFAKYTEEELLLSSEKRIPILRELTVGIKTLRHPENDGIDYQLKLNTEENTEKLKNFLKSNSKFSFVESAIINAEMELYVYKNYKYCLLECFIAIESLIVSFLSEYKLLKGISKNKIKDFETEIGISYLINIELPLVIGELSEETKEIIKNVDSLRKIRNDIVHKNKDITKEQAEKSIRTTIDLVRFVNSYSLNK